MSRYSLSPSHVDVPYPWSADLIWDRNGVLQASKSGYILIKLANGGLQDALPAPLLILKPTAQGLTNVTAQLLPISTDFAITRELLIADLNGDGHDDFFLSNHGPEPSNTVFPGEKNAIYTYIPSSGYYAERVTPDVDFSHGSTLGDFNGDGRTDIYVHNLGSASGTRSYLLLQQADGSFKKAVLPDNYFAKAGPLNAALDIQKDGLYELATVVGNGELLIWQNMATATPNIVGSALRLPISVNGVFEIRSADFDANGHDDILVVGTGDEMINSAGVVVGGSLKAIFVMDAGTPNQRILEPIKTSGIAHMVTGGVRVELADIDNSGTIDVELRTYDTNWQWHRYTLCTGRDQKFSIVQNADNTRAIKASYIDVNADGILDLVSDQGFFLRIQHGQLLDRFDGRAYDMLGQAGVAAKLIAAIFGKEFLGNPQYVGIGLSLLEGGMDYETLGQFALSAARLNTPDRIVTQLWTNLVGDIPTELEKAPFIEMLAQGTSAGTLARFAAETELNQQNIDLVGLAKTGLEYLMP